MRATADRSRHAPAVALLLAILAALAIHAVAVVSAYDDAFITFRYVRNVVEGRGAVYNTGERLFGISTPLYAAWLSFLHLALPNVDLPVLAARTNGLFLAAAGLLAYLLVVRLGVSAWTAALAGAAVVLSDGILRASIGGMESSMFLALAFGTALASLTRRDATALLLASLAALARPEGILLAGLVVLGRLIDPETRWISARHWVAITPLVAWVVGATIYYGTPIPHSIIAKSRPLYPLPAGAAVQNLIRHTGEWTLDGVELVGRTAAGLAGLAIRWERVLTAPFMVLAGAIVTLWGLAAWPRATDTSWARSLLLPGFFVALLILYLITNPFLLPWYFPLAHAPWLIIVLASSAHRPLGSRVALAGARAACRQLVTALVGVTAFGLTLAHLGPSDWSLLSRGASSAKQAEVLEAYRRTASWVESHSDPAETVAAAEIGMLGYHLDRKIFDACGLVSREAIPFLPVPLEQRGSQQGVISVDFVRATSPDLVVALPTFVRPSLLRSDWFSGAYGLVHEESVQHGAGREEGVLVFRRRGSGRGASPTGH